MANSPASKSETAKPLKEHLHEQQEPFSLNIFLSERGYLVKCFSSNGRNGCCSIDLFKNLKRSRSYSLINKKLVLLSARVVKSILYKLASPNNDSQELSCCSCSNKANQDEFQTAEPNSFTEVKGLMTQFGAFPSCTVEEEFLPSKYDQPVYSSGTFQASNFVGMEQEKTLVTEKTCQRKCTQDKHLNLMSMLNKLPSDRVHHIIARQESPSSRNSTLTENAKGNFMFATFPWKLLGKSLMERYTLISFKEGKEIIEPYSPQCLKNQVLVNQRKPLFNLSEKSIITNDKLNVRNRYNYIHWFIGVEKLGKLIRAEQIYSCRKNTTNSSSDFLGTIEEWNYTQKMQRKICFELGDTIMDEILEEIIHLLQQ